MVQKYLAIVATVALIGILFLLSMMANNGRYSIELASKMANNGRYSIELVSSRAVGLTSSSAVGYLLDTRSGEVWLVRGGKVRKLPEGPEFGSN